MALYSTNGVCYATQLELMDALAISKSTLNTRIRKLRDAGVVEKRGNAWGLTVGVSIGYENSVYTLNNNKTFISSNTSQRIDVPNVNNVIDVSSDSSDSTPISPREIVTYWYDSYLATYGTPYEPASWAKEVQAIKRLLTRYNVDKLKAIIDVVMRLYGVKWASGRFTRPTIGALVTWLAQQAEPYATANEGNDQGASHDSETGSAEEIDVVAKGWI